MPGAEPLRQYVINHLPNEAGLYGILGYDDEEDGEWVLALMEQMGVSGIGGKRSGGCGRFHFGDDQSMWIKTAVILTMPCLCIA